LAGNANGYASGISADGSVIVGYSSSNVGEHGGQGAGGVQAYVARLP
jgi:uncharacterized membrane protein